MNPNTKRELRRFTSTYAKALEPIMVLAILVTFALPILTVINLTPETRSTKSNNILGVEDKSELTITSVGGEHDFITNEMIYNEENGSKNYSATVKKHDIGSYSKPVFTIKNNTTETKKVKTTSRSDQTVGMEMGIIFKDVNYILQGFSGELFFHTLTVEPGQEITVFLTFESDTNIAFDQTVNLNLLVQ